MNGTLAQTTTPRLPALRRILRRVPGASLLAEFFRPTPGSWLFRSPTTDWLSQSALVSQLPFRYRMFAGYCSAQRGQPVGAELLLRLIIWLGWAAGAESAVRLNMSGGPAFVDLSDPRFLAVPGELSVGLPRILKAFLGPGDTLIDVGANHGSFSVTAAQLVEPGGLVVAIEPQARLADLVRRSLELYRVPFTVHNVACSDCMGTAKLYVPRASSGSGGLHASYSAVSRHQTATVRLVRLDDLLRADALPGRVFVKLDVEGSETRCLDGARNFLAHAKPAILIEVNSSALEAAGSSTAALAAMLRESGYDRYLRVEDLEREHVLTNGMAGQHPDGEHAMSAGPVSFNIIALHNAARVPTRLRP
jgi:FkbM family methyltransferase